MSWIEELKRVTIREVGLATQIRDVMKNEWNASEEDLREFIGPDWREVLDSFRRKGQLKVRRNGKRYLLKVVVHGDRKREKIKNLAAKKRTGKDCKDGTQEGR